MFKIPQCFRIRALAELFFKTNYDFGRPDINLYNYHPQLLGLLATLGLFYNKKDSWARLIIPVLSLVLTTVAVGLESNNINHGIVTGDYSFVCECVCYMVLLATTPGVFVGILTNRDRILSLLSDINDDFIQFRNMGPLHRVPFMKNQLLIWKTCIVWFFFASATGLMFIIYPILLLNYQSLFMSHDENYIRPLAFPLWLANDDPYRTPNYEMFLVLECSFAFVIVQAFCGYVYLLFHILLHLNTVLEMIFLDFDILFDDLNPTVAYLPKSHPSRKETQYILNKRIGRIVTWHVSVFKALSTVSSVFGPPLIYQVSCSSIAICLMFFQIAKKADAGQVDVLFTTLSLGAVVQLWIPCYLGTLLKDKGLAVGDACFYCGWNQNPLSRMIRNDLILIILRAQKPIYIKFTGLPNIELETYSSLMSSAYSYFTMLRQYDR